LKFTIFVFFVLINFFNCDLLSSSTNMTQVNSTKSSFSSDTINLIFICRCLKILMAVFTDFALVTKMSIIYKNCRLICLGFNIFIKNERSVCMYFESFLHDTLFLLGFWVNLKIFIFLSLLLDFNPVRDSVAVLRRFERNRLFIYIGDESPWWFLTRLVKFYLRVVLTWRIRVPKVHYYIVFI